MPAFSASHQATMSAKNNRLYCIHTIDWTRIDIIFDPSSFSIICYFNHGHRRCSLDAANERLPVIVTQRWSYSCWTILFCLEFSRVSSFNCLRLPSSGNHRACKTMAERESGPLSSSCTNHYNSQNEFIYILGTYKIAVKRKSKWITFPTHEMWSSGKQS